MQINNDILKQLGVEVGGDKIKIYYEQVVNDYELMRLIFPPTILYRIKNDGYIYWDDLTKQIRYDVAVYIFRKQDVIRANIYGQDTIYFDKFTYPEYSNKQPELVENVSQSDMIKYFEDYNRLYNVFVSVNENEYETATFAPNAIFMDTELSNLNSMQLDYQKFVLDSLYVFLNTHRGSIPFLPAFGTKIKEYLHSLDIYTVADVLKTELAQFLDNFIVKAAQYDIELDINQLDVKVEETIEHATIKLIVVVQLNGKLYEYHVVTPIEGI